VTARLVFLTGLAVSLCAQKKPITIDTVVEQRHEREGSAPVWAPDGKHFAYFRGEEIRLYDLAAKSEKKLLSLEPLFQFLSRRDSIGKTAE